MTGARGRSCGLQNDLRILIVTAALAVLPKLTKKVIL